MESKFIRKYFDECLIEVGFARMEDPAWFKSQHSNGVIHFPF